MKQNLTHLTINIHSYWSLMCDCSRHEYTLLLTLHRSNLLRTTELLWMWKDLHDIMPQPKIRNGSGIEQRSFVKCQVNHLCQLRVPYTNIRDRITLEKHKSPNANEVLLTDNAGHIYEGMASNFFAIVRENGSPILVTASTDHVLLGTIMKIVLHVCEKRSIPIKWSFPDLKDAIDGKWEGCFISSKLVSEQRNEIYANILLMTHVGTSRLVLPIETIQFKDERLADLCMNGKGNRY